MKNLSSSLTSKLSPLIIATFISDFGSSITIAVIPLLFLKLNHPDGMAYFNTFDSIGCLIGSFFVMAWIDRFKKNKIAVVADLIKNRSTHITIFY